MELKPGVQTSEFKLAIGAVILGCIAEGTAGVLNSMQAQGVTAAWFPTVLLVCGLLMQLASVFGYTKSRTITKVAAIENGLVVEGQVVKSVALPDPQATPAARSSALEQPKGP